MAIAHGVETKALWQQVGMALPLHLPELPARMTWVLHVPHEWLERHGWKLPSVRLDLTLTVWVALGFLVVCLRSWQEV